MAGMPGRQPEDWGIPLREAIQRWTPRELWESYRELESHDIPLLILGQKEDPRITEARRLRSEIVEILTNRLVRGELIASGIALPLKETSRRREIRSELWPCLSFDQDFTTVIGSGLKYDQVLIREARPAPPSATEQKQEAARPLQPPVRPLRARPGRPSIMPDIAAEMRRRAESWQLASSMRQEAKDLSAWAKQAFLGRAVPKPSSIERQLGPTYRELMARNSTDK